MTTTTNPTPAADTDWVGPCGCPACDKWTDCDWCGGCNPRFEQFIADMKSLNDRIEEEEARLAEEVLPFSAWLFGDED